MTIDIEFEKTKIPCITPGTLLTKKNLNDKIVRYRVINYNYSTISFFNVSGYNLFQRINGVISNYELAKNLTIEFNIDMDTALTDVIEFISYLYKQKIVYFLGEEPHKIIETSLMTKPQEIWLNITGRCNLKCITCFKDSTNLCREEMTTAKLKQTIDEIKNLGVGYIVISGGEPFIRDDIMEILNYLHSNDINMLIITNATLITEEIAKQLKKINPFVIQVSLDGSTPEINDKIRGEGVFNKTIQGAKYLINEGLNVRIYPTITRLNIYDWPNIKKLILELKPDYKRFAFAKFHPTGRGLQNKDDLYIPEDEFLEIMAANNLTDNASNNDKNDTPEEILNSQDDIDLTSFLPTRTPYGARKTNCGLGAATFSIESDGKVYPCHWLHFPKYKAGDLYENTLAEIYYKSEIFSECRMIRADSNIKNCPQCSYKYFCGGGCRARGLFDGGDITSCDPHCKYIFKNFESGFWAESMFSNKNPNDNATTINPE